MCNNGFSLSFSRSLSFVFVLIISFRCLATLPCDEFVLPLRFCFSFSLKKRKWRTMDLTGTDYSNGASHIPMELPLLAV